MPFTITSLTAGVRISVTTRYEERFSNPHNHLYLFSYEITIENTNAYAIQLLRRKWTVVDALTNKREVEGEGVVGEQPIVQPGESYTYRSSCDFATDAGKMSGKYHMLNLETQKEFEVSIPEFSMLVPVRLN